MRVALLFGGLVNWVACLMIKPSRLRPGDTIAAISLSSGAGAAFPARFSAGKRQIESTFGLRVIETPHASRSDAWLYANPQARADDLHWALQNDEVRGIFSVIGGDESVRILPFVDPELIRAHPKVFMGFSDATVTMTAFLNAGVVAFNGPAVMTDLAENGGIRPFVRDSIRSVLFDAEAAELRPASEYSEEFLDWSDPSLQERPRQFAPSEGWLRLQGSGRVKGHLMGGNIEVLEFLKGTQWWPRRELWDGAILAFEMSEEAPSVANVGRFLRNYGSQGILGRASALLFARPQAYTMAARCQLHAEIVRILREFGRSDLPVIANMDFGHTSPQLVLPLGVQAKVDADTNSVRLLEPAVS